jgi:predicted transcriptional regulator
MHNPGTGNTTNRSRGRPRDEDGSVTQYVRGGVVELGESELKPWEPERIRPIHQQIVALAACGLKNKEIAEKLGVSESHVSVILNHPETQDLKNQLTTDYVVALTRNTRTRIEAAANEAIDKVVALMRHGKSEQVQQRSAFDILDRAGFKPREVHVNTNINLNREDAQMLTDALHETVREVETFEEASYREVEAERDGGTAAATPTHNQPSTHDRGPGSPTGPAGYPTRDGD